MIYQQIYSTYGAIAGNIVQDIVVYMNLNRVKLLATKKYLRDFKCD